MINATEEVDRMLVTLRNKIRERGFTQLKVQADLQWGRSYISQLLTKQKSLRVEQVLQILDVIGIEPAEFFAELFRWPAEEPGAGKGGFVNDPAVELEMRRKLDHLQSSLEGLVRVLVERDLIAANESVTIFGGPAAPAPKAPRGRKKAKAPERGKAGEKVKAGAEKGRAAAGKSRGAAEKSRDTAEKSRGTAEKSRGTAEKSPGRRRKAAAG